VVFAAPALSQQLQSKFPNLSVRLFILPISSSNKALLLAVYLPALIMAFGSGLLIPIMPLYARSFEASYSLVGVVLAAQGLGTLISDVPAGLLIRRIGHKRVMLLGGACIIAGILGLIWANTLVEAIIYRLLSGSGMAMWGISRHAYIADIIQVNRRGRSIAVLGGIGRIGVFLGPVLGGAIGKAYGLRAPFLLFSALGVVALVVVMVWVAGVREGEGSKSHDVEEHSLWTVLKGNYKTLLTAGSGQLFAQMIRTARHIIIPLYATDILGLDVQSVGLIISIASAVDMLMFLPAGMVMDRFGRKFAFVPSFFIQAMGMLLIPMTGSFLELLAVATLIGLGNGLGSGTMMTLGADLAPERSRGEFLGLWRFVGDIGSAGSPLLVGGIADLLGLVTTPLFISGMGLLGAAILGLLVPETLKRETG